MGSIPQLTPAALLSPVPYSSGSLALAETWELYCQAGDIREGWLVAGGRGDRRWPWGPQVAGWLPSAPGQPGLWLHGPGAVSG